MSKKYVASLSCGKDSLAMVLRLMRENKPLDYAVMYDTGMEFKSVYRNFEKISRLLEEYGCKVILLKPETDFLFDMLIKPINQGKVNEHYGYDWCGGMCRWRTTHKTRQINKFLESIGEYEQYIGIAFDESERADYSNHKQYPLIEWKMTESDCLKYCYDCGFNWYEESPAVQCGYIDLYQILDRVSCWCCGNKNLKELRNIYFYLPTYWSYLKGLQSRIDRPFRRDGKTIFDLENRFLKERVDVGVESNYCRE